MRNYKYNQKFGYKHNFKRTFTPCVIFALLGLIITSMGLFIQNSTVFEESVEYKDDQGVFTTPDLQNGVPIINETFTGVGKPLEYHIHAEGQGGSQGYVNITQQPFVGNQTSDLIILPNSSFVNDINFSVSDIEWNNQSLHIINQSLVYCPNYIIYYTQNTNTQLNNLTWVNITINDYPEAEVGDVNIYLDGIINQTFVGSGTHNNSLNITEPGTYAIVLEFFYQNGTFFRNQSLSVSRSFLPGFNMVLSSPPSSPVNPFIRLNNNLTGQDEELIAFEFQVDTTSELSSLEIFAKYDLALTQDIIYNLSIMICGENGINEPDHENPLGMIDYSGNIIGTQTTPGWISLDFSEDNIELITGNNYYLVFNASGVENHANTVYFDLYTTNFEIDASQNSQLYNETLNQWIPMEDQKAAIFRIATDQFIPTNLTYTQINATLYNSQLIPTTKSFDEDTNSTEFNVLNDQNGPWAVETNNLIVTFNSNLTCRFKYSYSLNITQIKTGSLTNFTAYFDSSQTQWQGWVNASVPVSDQGNAIFNQNTFNYSVYFPYNWQNMDGTTISNEYVESEIPNTIFINETVSDLNWTFNAFSDFTNPFLQTLPEDRIDFAPKMNITCSISLNTTQYNATLSFWNVSFTESSEEDLGFGIASADYLDYSEKISHVLVNQSSSHIFSDFTVPDDYDWDTVTAKISWHNETDSGIYLRSFIIKYNATLINSSYYHEVSRGNNISLSYEYLEDNYDSIDDALVSSSWAENWSYYYNETSETYEFDLEIWGDLGEIVYFSVNFSHENYISQVHTQKIFIVIGTSLILREGNEMDNIYANQSLYLGFSWFDELDRRISTKKEDDSRSIEVWINNIEIDNVPGTTQWHYDHTEENPNNPNLFISVHTRYLPYTDFIGLHNITMNLSRSNSTTVYESQSYTFIFQINKIPSSLELYSSSAYNAQNKEIDIQSLERLIEFEQYDGLVEVKILYNYLATYDNNPNMVAFDYGNVYGYIRDLSIGETVISPTLLVSPTGPERENGVYHYSFSITNLDPSHNYEIRFYSDTNNVESSSFEIAFKIIPRWDLNIDIKTEKIQLEGKPLILEGYVKFSNGSHTWAAQNINIDIRVIFTNDTGVFTYNVSIRTGEDGSFYYDELIVPNVREYQLVNITLAIEGDRTFKSNIENVLIRIEEDFMRRYAIPAIITVILVLIAVPVINKWAYPFLKQKVEKTGLYKKIESSPIFRKFYKNITKKEYALSPSVTNPNGLDAIKTIKIPLLSEEYHHLTTIDDNTSRFNLEVEEIPIKMEEDQDEFQRPLFETIKRINTRIKNIQDIFSPKMTPQDLLILKNNKILQGKMLEENEKFFDSTVNYYFAQEYSRRLGLEEEVILLENLMNRLLVKLDAKEQLKFIKNYKIRGQKERNIA